MGLACRQAEAGRDSPPSRPPSQSHTLMIIWQRRSITSLHITAICPQVKQTPLLHSKMAVVAAKKQTKCPKVLKKQLKIKDKFCRTNIKAYFCRLKHLGRAIYISIYPS